jgi:hypothetical protein
MTNLSWFLVSVHSETFPNLVLKCLFQDTICHYYMRYVDADNNPTTPSPGTSFITQYVFTCKSAIKNSLQPHRAIQTVATSAGPSLMMSWSRTSPHDVFALGQSRSGQKEVLIHMIHPRLDISSKHHRRRLWRTQGSSSGPTVGGETLTSILPLELNLVLLGYSLC